MTVSATSSMEKVMTRLLSARGRVLRVALIDNLKTGRFSWADFEAVVTAKSLSGHELYQGEGNRPNLLVWILTVNAPGLSKDVAERTVTIRLTRPEFDPDWEATVRDYIEEHRTEIFADCQALIENTQSEGSDELDTHTRLSEWEQAILSKTETPKSCQTAIADRRKAFDEDDLEKDLVRDEIVKQLRLHGHSLPETRFVFISSQALAEWMSVALRERLNATCASRRLGRLAITELVERTRFKGRVSGWLWRGADYVGGPDSEPVEWDAETVSEFDD